MWPFTPGDNDKSPENISPSLQSFFEKEDQHARLLKFEKADSLEPRSQSKPTTLSGVELLHYRQSTRQVASVNCAELQHAVLECYKGWKYLKGTECSEAMTRTTKCMDLQQEALRRLRYEECSSKDECMQIRVLVDEMFTRNFGKLGENINEDTMRVYESDLRRTQQYFSRN